MTLHRSIRLTAGLFALALAAPALAADYAVEPAGSTLGFSGTFQGAGFDGHFARFDAQIRYDPADLAGAKFDVTVDLASAATGDADRDSALPSSDFFDVARFPKAHFVTTGFRKNADGSVSADGTLDLHGVTQPVVLAVRFSGDAQRGELDVGTTLKRLAFGVGGGEYADTSTIADEVAVKAHLKLVAKP